MLTGAKPNVEGPMVPIVEVLIKVGVEGPMDVDSLNDVGVPLGEPIAHRNES